MVTDPLEHATSESIGETPVVLHRFTLIYGNDELLTYWSDFRRGSESALQTDSKQFYDATLAVSSFKLRGQCFTVALCIILNFYKTQEKSSKKKKQEIYASCCTLPISTNMSSVATILQET